MTLTYEQTEKLKHLEEIKEKLKMEGDRYEFWILSRRIDKTIKNMSHEFKDGAFGEYLLSVEKELKKIERARASFDTDIQYELYFNKNNLN